MPLVLEILLTLTMYDSVKAAIIERGVTVKLEWRYLK